MKTALIVDPSLVSRTGHHYNAAKAFKVEVEKQGWHASILVSAKVDKDVLSELSASACFTRTVYDRNDWTRTGFDIECDTFFELLSDHLTGSSTFPAMIILPSCNQTQLLGLAKVIDSLKPAWNPRVVAWLLFPPKLFARVEGASDVAQHEEYRDAFGKLKAVMGTREALHIVCETETLKDTYWKLSGHPVHLLYPPSRLESQPPITAPRNPEGDIHLVVTGHANLHKGYGLLPEALREVIQSHGNVRATIHGDVRSTGNPDVLSLMKSIDGVGPEVTVLTESLSTESYFDLLGSADLVVLPYNPRSYENRGSGVFYESTRLGIPAVVPLGCRFASDAIKERRAIAIEVHTAASLSKAISIAIDDLSVLRMNAGSYAAKISKVFSSSEFVAELLSSSPHNDEPNARAGSFVKFRHVVMGTYKKLLN